MNETTEQNRPRYYRLLEKGEKRQVGLDFRATGFGNLKPITENALNNICVFRPVQVDEWVSYAERKPTKEDFEPTGEVEYIANDRPNGKPHHGSFTEGSSSHLEGYWIQFWRRITPPEQPKPKIVKLQCANGRTIDITPLPSGIARLGCGDEIMPESIDEFIKAREEVTRK